MLSGYLGGDSDRIIMRISDMAMALPDMPTTIILGAFGPSLKNIIIAILCIHGLLLPDWFALKYWQ